MRMSPMLPKHLMSEEDIKFQYITPAITVKWSKDKITMETKITDGRINLKGNFAFRETPKRLLWWRRKTTRTAFRTACSRR